MRKFAGQLAIVERLQSWISHSTLLDGIMEAFGKVEGRKLAKSKKADGSEIAKSIRGARILLVEDNEINQQVAQEILEGAGLIVSIAENGQVAVDMVGKTTYDAVLMDVLMPVMDGYTATRTIMWPNLSISTRFLRHSPSGLVP